MRLRDEAVNNEPCWIVWFEWEEWGEVASRQIWVPKADFPNPSDAVEHARENEFARWEHPGVRRVEDSVTCDEVEW